MYRPHACLLSCFHYSALWLGALLLSSGGWLLFQWVIILYIVIFISVESEVPLLLWFHFPPFKHHFPPPIFICLFGVLVSHDLNRCYSRIKQQLLALFVSCILTEIFIRHITKCTFDIKNILLYCCYMFRRHLPFLQRYLHQNSKLTETWYITK